MQRLDVRDGVFIISNVKYSYARPRVARSQPVIASAAMHMHMSRLRTASYVCTHGRMRITP